MKKAFAFILLSSFLFRLWFALGYWEEKPLTHDANEYLELAKNLLKKGEFRYDEHHTLQIEPYGRAPGYPFWLSSLMRIQESVGWIRIVEVLLSILTLSIIFRLSEEVFNARVGFIAFLIAACYFPLIWLIPAILSENLWILLILCSYLYLFKLRKAEASRTKLRYLFIAFTLLGIATLVRPGTLFVLPVFIWWTFKYAGLRKAVAFALFYFVVLSPWNIYLFLQHGRPIFVASEGGITFWTGSHPKYRGEGDLSVNPAVQKEYRELLRAHPEKTPDERETIYFQLARRNILSHPHSYIWIELKKLYYWILPVGPSVMESSILHRIIGIAFYMPILIFSILAFRRVVPEYRYFFLALYGCYTLMILIFIPQERFRIATIDPLLIVISSFEINRRFGHRLMRHALSETPSSV